MSWCWLEVAGHVEEPIDVTGEEGIKASLERFAAAPWWSRRQNDLQRDQRIKVVVGCTGCHRRTNRLANSGGVLKHNTSGHRQSQQELALRIRET